MSGWFQSDATGVTLRLPPLPNPPQTLLLMLVAGVLLFLLLWLLKAWPGRAEATKRIARLGRASKAFLGSHYVALVFSIVAFICLWAAWIGLLRVPALVGGLLDELQESTRDSSDPERTRRIVFALTAVLAAITIFGTLIVQSIRVWINERTARTAEANLTTGLINTAVEALGTEKTVSRIGRPVRLVSAQGGPDIETIIEWQGEAAPADSRIREPGDWRTFEFTTPNLEVRIGAILTLERIARDNPREHIRVMDILCAYIRENAAAHEVSDHDLGKRPDYPKEWSEAEWQRYRIQVKERKAALTSWIAALPPRRTDVQVALEVIGRRPEERKEREETAEARGGKKGYRLDLRNSNLRHHDIAHLDFQAAELSGARLEGANLSGAHLARANLSGARLSGANLQGGHLAAADLRGADLEGAELQEVDLNDKAKLNGANLWGANLRKAHLVAANLIGADLRETRAPGAHLMAALLQGAHLEGANLIDAHLEEARLSTADLRGTYLIRAHLSGANLGGADFRRSNWTGASTSASPVEYADLRGVEGLSQAQLDPMIGHDPLLPEGLAPDTGEPFYVWSCWETPPPDLDRIVITVVGPDARARAAQRARFLCGPGRPRRKTGIPLPPDVPYPSGHPLWDR